MAWEKALKKVAVAPSAAHYEILTCLEFALSYNTYFVYTMSTAWKAPVNNSGLQPGGSG